MKKRIKFFSAPSVLAVVFMSFALVGCGSKDDPDITSPGDSVVQFTNVTASGVPTSKLTLTFDKAVEGLSAADITLSGSTGAEKGSLAPVSPAGTYELAVNGVSSAGNVTVAVSKAGYTFTPSSKAVAVSISSGSGDTAAVQFTNATASGVPTGKLTLTFDKAVEGLSAADITLNAGSTGTEKGSLTAAGTAGVYELAVSGVSSAGNVTVTVSKTGYTFTPASKTVAVSVLTDPPIDPTKFTVWFNTNFATPAAITPVQVDADAADKKISAPAATLTREGFTFSGWYKDYGVDPATGLWKYDDADKWNFDTDTVTGNMTLYAGWSGGVKRMPRTYIWNNQPSILEGRLIQLQEGKTYKMGARYIMQPNFGPVYLIARYRSGTGYVTETPRVTLLNTAAGFFKTSEEEFTASYTGWHFIGITMFNTATDPTGGGTYVLHEVWLKEKDGGDINLLNNGDFIQKDLEDSSSIYHRVVNNGQDPFYEAGTPGPRTEWDSASWNLNHNQVHYPYSWTNFIDNLSELTGDAISNGDYSSLQFLKPAHP